MALKLTHEQSSKEEQQSAKTWTIVRHCPGPRLRMLTVTLAKAGDGLPSEPPHANMDLTEGLYIDKLPLTWGKDWDSAKFYIYIHKIWVFCQHAYLCTMYMSGTHRGSKTVLDLLELETVSHPLWCWELGGCEPPNVVLGMGLRFSTRMIHALSHYVISLDPKIVFLKHQSLFSLNYYL